MDITEVKELYKAFRETEMEAFKNNPASTSLVSTPALQGPLQGNPSLGGLFSAPGVRPDRYSAFPRVRSFAKLLTPQPSDIYNEILSIVTGATDGSGNNASDFCGTAPIAGALKQCEQQLQYGKWFSKTNINSINDIGYLRNRADVPGQILNGGPAANPLIPDIMYKLVDTRSQLQYELYLQGTMIERSLERALILGNPSNSNSGTPGAAGQNQRGFIKEFKGIDLQIKTGYADTSGVLCPAADSIVVNFASANIGATIAGGDGRTITTAISDVWYALKDRATQVGMDGIEYAIVMRKEMFRALTDIYANTYATTRFQSNTYSAGLPLIQDATRTNDLRVEMLNGQYLIIEGEIVPVVFSDGIPLDPTGGANNYKADMYFVPLSWAGRPLLRLEFFNLGNQYIEEWTGFLNPQRRRVINNGFYAMGYNSVSMCDEYLFASVMRLILETPFLAARIDDVEFSYLAATRDPYPGTSMYVDGGISYYSPRAV
jgi:hypothetical protein